MLEVKYYHLVPTEFSVGGYVLVSYLVRPPVNLVDWWAGPYRIAAKQGNNVQLGDLTWGPCKSVDVSRLRNFVVAMEWMYTLSPDLNRWGQRCGVLPMLAFQVRLMIRCTNGSITDDIFLRSLAATMTRRWRITSLPLRSSTSLAWGLSGKVRTCCISNWRQNSPTTSFAKLYPRSDCTARKKSYRHSLSSVLSLSQLPNNSQ